MFWLRAWYTWTISTKPPLTARLWQIWAVLIGLGFLGRLSYGYEVDELMHLHTAWKIGQGALPFRDFYDNHLPVWHYLAAPFVKSLVSANLAVLITCRLVALGVLIGGLACFYRLVRRVSPTAAPWAVGALILIHPFGTSAFELRPDWLAILAIFGSLNLLLAGKRAPTFIAGLLGGFALVLTQKSTFLIFGVVLWALLTAFFAEPGQPRRTRVLDVAVLVFGICLPASGLVLLYAMHQSVPALIDGGYLQNMKWMREDDLLSGAQESLLANFPIFALAFAKVATLFRNPKAQLRSAAMESLVSFLLVFGSLAFLATPVPIGQWFLFMVPPWAAILGALYLVELAQMSSISRNQIRDIVIGVVITLVALRWYNILLAIGLWGPILFFLRRKLRQSTESDFRVARSFTWVMALGVLVFVGRIVDEVRMNNCQKQLAFIAYVESRIPPGEPLLTTWPNMAPFRTSPTYHSYAIGGIYTTLSVHDLEREYVGALKKGQSKVVVMRPIDVDPWLPGLVAYVRSHGKLVRKERINLREIECYSFP